MNNYSTYRLNEICKISTGKWDANHAVENGRYRFYTCSNKFTMCDTASFNGECVIVPGNGDLGLLFYYNGEFDAYQRTYVLSDIKIYPKYLYYHMKYKWRNSTEKLNYGSTIKYVRITNFTSYEIGVPDIEIQRAIVARIEELFAELDKAVEHLCTAQQQLKTYRQAVLNHWLTNGSKRWKMVTIGDIVEKVEYGSSAKSQKTGRVPVLRMGNIQNGRFDWSDLVYSDDDEEIKKYLLKKDDVLFNRTNSPELVGKTAIYKGEHPAIFAGYLIRLHRKEDLINADFLNYYLNSDIAKNYGNTVKSDGVNQSNINGQKLKTYPLFLPSLSEQQRIVEEIETRLSQAEAVEVHIAEALQKTESLRQSILKKAFSGELV